MSSMSGPGRTTQRGTFADWNPNVTCDDYTVDGSHAHD